MVKVWTNVFDLPHDTPDLEDHVVTCLQAMRAEMQLLTTKLSALGVDSRLMHPGMVRFRNVASPSVINQSWKGLRDEISRPENQLAFMWANWALRDENEDDMPDDDLAALRGELDALDAALEDAEMTPYLRGFVQRQVGAIRSALRVYRVQGVKPIEEALQQVAGIYNFEKAKIEAEYADASAPTRSLLARAASIVKSTADVADNLDKIRKSAEGGYRLAASVAPMVVTWVQELAK